MTDGGSLAASRARCSLQVNTAPRLQSPRGAETGLQSNVVTRQPRERAGDKSGGSRKRPVLVLEDRLLGPGFSERINLSRQPAGNLEHCTQPVELPRLVVFVVVVVDETRGINSSSSN